jgi:hypothetical protein
LYNGYRVFFPLAYKCLHLVLKILMLGAMFPLLFMSYEPDAYLSIRTSEGSILEEKRR